MTEQLMVSPKCSRAPTGLEAGQPVEIVKLML